MRNGKRSWSLIVASIVAIAAAALAAPSGFGASTSLAIVGAHIDGRTVTVYVANTGPHASSGTVVVTAMTSGGLAVSEMGFTVASGGTTAIELEFDSSPERIISVGIQDDGVPF